MQRQQYLSSQCLSSLVQGAASGGKAPQYGPVNVLLVLPAGPDYLAIGSNQIVKMYTALSRWVGETMGSFSCSRGCVATVVS